VLEERARRIAGDLEGAQNAKARADSGIQAAADATAKARSEAQAAINARLSPEQKIELFRTMVRIRRFEERSLRAYQAKKIGGFLHLYVGQEAVAAGCCSILGTNDHVITAYRDHGHAIAVGMDMKALMAELYGKATGCSKGKGGSMHFFDPARHFWGGHGIVGGQIPLGIGIAYALKYQGVPGACLAFMGDGAVNQGAVHESYNLAALWQLPVVFVIENNKYGMGTSVERASASHDLSKNGGPWGIPGLQVDGMDVQAVHDAAEQAVAYCRAGNGPFLLEVKTYRYRGHSMSDPAKYRSREEVQKMRSERDCIEGARRKLTALGVAEAEIAAIDSDVK